jgi:hypothetical protein
MDTYAHLGCTICKKKTLFAFNVKPVNELIKPHCKCLYCAESIYPTGKAMHRATCPQRPCEFAACQARGDHPCVEHCSFCNFPIARKDLQKHKEECDQRPCPFATCPQRGTHACVHEDLHHEKQKNVQLERQVRELLCQGNSRFSPIALLDSEGV